ncbi:winged helix-turn-helix domain-containing protein, partial [Staphylococcus aureus]
VLAAANGDLVGRDRLLAAVWPGQAIDDSVVRVHLSSLRKALGDPGLVSNEAGRGYRLTLPVLRNVQAEPGIVRPPYRPLAGLIGR